jgi:3-oxoacyl-[acyl-carrier protein] reductase
MDLQLADKVALITGASRGIGRAIARLLRQEGTKLALVGRRKNLLSETADELSADGEERPLILAEDITADGAADRIKRNVLERFERLDVLINNAGGSRPVDGLGSDEEWEEGMRLNFHAGRSLAQAFIETMQKQKFGRIINITGTEEPHGMNAAVPPNGAIHIWAKGLSRIIAKDGITVNCIAPGIVHSEQIDQRVFPSEQEQREWAENNIPLGYIGEAEDVALVAVFLSSPRARYTTGELIYVDGGTMRTPH